jgi:predicted alpha/beta hydrolase family esterase
MGSVAVLILPGINDSGPTHWQSLWQQAIPAAHRVSQADWDHPVCAAWVAALHRTVDQLAGSAVLVAHSLGCLQVVHAAAAGGAGFARAVRGALLVAPPDPDAPSFPDIAVGFRPLPLAPLPFASVVVASRTDPYSSFEFSQRMAAAWGSELVDLGACGHINATSGLGAWAAGRAWLDRLMPSITDTPR